MGITDDIFDVENDLENLQADESTKEAFDRIIIYLGRIETQNQEWTRFFRSFVDLRSAMDNLEKINDTR